MNKTETISAYGHRNIQANHRSTLEITMANRLSKRGDCVIAVSADKSVETLDQEFKLNIRKRNAKIRMLINVGGVIEAVNGFGDPQLILTHPEDIVMRKSGYICERTLAIKSDKAAKDLSRELVRKLRDPMQKVLITLTVEV
ncbi:MAG: DUF371 domain-containing protein [Candidatus Bathyarchaeota archaeon]|jgi:hypothetical protein